MLNASVTSALVARNADRVADFRTQRHTFITNLAMGGVHPKLARHSTIGLTMDRYTHQYAGDEVATLDVLPDLDTPATETLKATGTTDQQAGAIPTLNNLASSLAQLGTQDETQ